MNDDKEEIQWEEASVSKLLNLDNQGTYLVVLLFNTDKISPPVMELLKSPQMWVGDT